MQSTLERIEARAERKGWWQRLLDDIGAGILGDKENNINY